MDDWESDRIVEQWLHDSDDLIVPLPNIESEPHLLISKVRKHYMEYLIKLLSDNYSSNQRLINKNIYLPSAIWRCAKTLEMSAAKSSMAIQLYRQNIITVIKELKENTKNKKLNRKLYNCLRTPPENEQKTQTRKFNECNCKCTCNLRKKSKQFKAYPLNKDQNKKFHLPDKNKVDTGFTNVIESTIISYDKTGSDLNDKSILNLNDKSLNLSNKNIQNSFVAADNEMKNSDDLMQQLEKLFESENDDDNIFDITVVECEEQTKKELDKKIENIENQLINSNSRIIQPQTKLVDEGTVRQNRVLVNKLQKNVKENKSQNTRITKWMCEEYFLKTRLFELLDELRDNNRCKLEKLKNRMLDLFGCDSDEEGVVSPIEETPDFVTSCKERITPWVVRILTPYYVKGRIRGRTIFKSLAKHLIQLIYQCSKYPYDYEVESFVKDFLESHTLIQCEADFQQFRIENI